MARCVHKLPKKKTVKERIITAIIVAIVIFAAIGLMAYSSKNAKQPKDYFVQYDNATTLVEVCYGEYSSLLGYTRALGFMDDDIYQKYKNNEYTEGKIEIYHPYVKGGSITVDIESVVSISTKTYESFYSYYPPSVYAK